MTDNTTLFFITIAGIYLILLIAGIFYAAYISGRPMRDGYTYISVIVGVAFTLIGITLLIAITLHNEAYSWLVLIHPWVAFAVTGIPMSISQEWKRRQVNRRNDDLMDEVNNGV